jgi:hypothetical protein
MHRSFAQAAIVTKTDRRLGLAILFALVAFDCGGTASDTNNPGSAGTSQAGGSAGGTSGAGHGGAGGSSGSVASGGTAHAAGASGAGGSAGAASSGAAGKAAAGSAGSGGAAGGASGQACGDQTCSANQYCRAPCSGTGLAGSQSLGNPICSSLPAACNGVPTCECICGFLAFFCTPGAFEVQCGCA